jgi:WD40 repeat protein
MFGIGGCVESRLLRGERTYLASACQSGNIYFRQLIDSGFKAPSSMCRFDGESIEAIAMNPMNPQILVVGTNAGKASIIDSSEVQNKNVHFKKGFKSIKTDMKVIEASLTQPIHGDMISCITWTSGNRFASGGYDHNLKISDLNTMKEQWNVYMKDMVPTALDFYPKSAILLAGYEDGYIRSFDEREKSKKAVSIYKSHSKYLSKVACLNDHIFASVSYSLLRHHTMGL